VSERVTFLDASLTKASEDAARWGWFWRATFATSAVVGFQLAPFFEKKADRLDSYANGFKSSVGFLFGSIFVLPAERHRDREAPTVSCAGVAALEATLVRDAEGEAQGRGIGMHILGGAFNTGVGVTLGIWHHRWWSAIGGAIVGGVVGSIRIFTQPTTAGDALKAYRAGDFKAAPSTVTASIVPTPGGALLFGGVTF